MKQVWRVSGDMLGKAIASAAVPWAWARLVLAASPVPRWAKYPRFLVCSGFRYGFRACDELVIHACWRRAGWTVGVWSLPMKACSLQASHRQGECCKTVDLVSLPHGKA